MRGFQLVASDLTGHRTLLCALIVAAVMQAALYAALPHFAQPLLAHRAWNSATMRISAVEIVLIATSLALGYAQTTIGQRLNAAVRRRLVSTLFGSIVHSLDPTRTTTTQSHLLVDVPKYADALTMEVPRLVRGICLAVAASVLAIQSDPRATAVAAASIVAFVGVASGIGAVAARFTRRERDQLHETQTILEDTIAHVDLISSFRVQDFFWRRYLGTYALLHRAQVRIRAVEALSGPLTAGLGIAVLLVALQVIPQSAGTQATDSRHLTFVAYIVLLLGSASLALNAAVRAVPGFASRARIAEIEQAGTAGPPRPRRAAPNLSPEEPLRRARPLSFENVRLQYPGRDHAAVAGLTFAIKAGQTVAVVGPTGSGKSTLAKIAAQLLIPTSGRVLLDGLTVQTSDPEELRSMVAYASQESPVFLGTLRENIVLGRDISVDRFRSVCAACRVDEISQRLPSAYDTPLDLAAASLSRGERQRVALARTLLSEAEVFVLDEVTASLDTRSEHAIHDAIARFCHDRTVLLVTHRLHMARSADRVMVLVDGVLVEDGAPDELIRSGGWFRDLLQLDERRTQGAPESAGSASPPFLREGEPALSSSPLRGDRG